MNNNFLPPHNPALHIGQHYMMDEKMKRAPIGERRMVAYTVVGCKTGALVGGLPGAVVGGAAGLALGYAITENKGDRFTFERHEHHYPVKSATVKTSSQPQLSSTRITCPKCGGINVSRRRKHSGYKCNNSSCRVYGNKYKFQA